MRIGAFNNLSCDSVPVAKNTIFIILRFLLLLTIVMQYRGVEARRVSVTPAAPRPPKAGLITETEGYLGIVFKTAKDVVTPPPQEKINFYMDGEPEKSSYSVSVDEGMASNIIADIEKGRCRASLFNETSAELPGVSLGFYSWATGSHGRSWPRGHYRAYLEGFGVEVDELRLACIEKIINDSYPLRYYVSDTFRVSIILSSFVLPAMAVLYRMCCTPINRVVYVEYRPQRERLIGPLLPMTLAFERQYDELHKQAEAAGLTDFIKKLEAFHLRYRCQIGLYLMDNPVTLGGVNCDLFEATEYLNNGGRVSLRDNTSVLPEAETWPQAHPLPVNVTIRESIQEELMNFERELKLLRAASSTLLDHVATAGGATLAP